MSIRIKICGLIGEYEKLAARIYWLFNDYKILKKDNNMNNKDLNNSNNGSGNDTSFKTRWKVAAGENITFQVMGSFTINWGDLTDDGDPTDDQRIDGKQDGFYELSHSYPTGGIYTVDISNSITGFSTQNARFVTRNTPEKLVEFKQCGTAQWKTMKQMFADAPNMVCTATDTPDLSQVKTMNSMFHNCIKFNAPIAHWDFSTVENIDFMLCNATKFDQDLRQLQVKPGTKTDRLFGPGKSLADYNKKYEERLEKHNAEIEKQEIKDILKK